MPDRGAAAVDLALAVGAADAHPSLTDGGKQSEAVGCFKIGAALSRIAEDLHGIVIFVCMDGLQRQAGDDGDNKTPEN